MVTDYSLNAADIKIGDVVNDDKTWDRIHVTAVHQFTGHQDKEPGDYDESDAEALVRFTGTREKAGDQVVRTWRAIDGVIIRRNED